MALLFDIEVAVGRNGVVWNADVVYDALEEEKLELHTVLWQKIIGSIAT